MFAQPPQQQQDADPGCARLQRNLAVAMGDPAMRRVPPAAPGTVRWACCTGGATDVRYRSYLVVWRPASPQARAASADGPAVPLSALVPFVGWATVVRERGDADELAVCLPGPGEPPPRRFRLSETPLEGIGVERQEELADGVAFALAAITWQPHPRPVPFPFLPYADAVHVRVLGQRGTGANAPWEWQVGRGRGTPDARATLARCLGAPGTVVLFAPQGLAARPGWWRQR